MRERKIQFVVCRFLRSCWCFAILFCCCVLSTDIDFTTSLSFSFSEKKDFFLFYFVRTSHTFYFPTHCTLHGKSLQIYIHIFLFSTSIFNFSLKFQFLSPRYLCKLLTFLSEFEKGILCNVRMSLHLTKIKWNQMKNKICKDHLLRFSWANVNELIATILKFFVPVARDCRLFGFWLH